MKIARAYGKQRCEWGNFLYKNTNYKKLSNTFTTH